MARLETTLLTASQTYGHNHAVQSERVETLRARIADVASGGRPDMVERRWLPSANTVVRFPVRGS